MMAADRFTFWGPLRGGKSANWLLACEVSENDMGNLSRSDETLLIMGERSRGQKSKKGSEQYKRF